MQGAVGRAQASGCWAVLAARKDGAWGLNSIGAIGGIDWGGVSIDPERGYAIANIANMPTMITVTRPRKG
jgi:glucose dehydrogenase